MYKIEWGSMIFLILYTISLLLMTKIASKKSKTTNDYLIGSWNVPLILVVCIMLGDWLGASVSIGVAQSAYDIGIGALAFTLGLGSGLIFLALFFSYKMRSLELITIGEMLGELYNIEIRTLSSIILAIAYFIISSAQLVGGGAIISQLTGCSLNIGIIVTLMVTLSILLGGGIWSIGFTNILNVLFIYFGFLLGTYYLIAFFGGMGSFISRIPKDLIIISNINFQQFFAVFFAAFLSVFVGQAGLMGIFCAKSPIMAKKATVLTGIFFIPIGLFCTLFGIGSRIIFEEGLPNTVQVLPALIATFPPILRLILFGSLWALLLSTTGPVIFALTQIILRDILPVIPNKYDKIKDYIFVKKTLTIVSVLCAITAFTILEILETTMFAYTIRNCLALIIISGIIFGKQSWINNPKGIKIGILLGAFTTLSWVLIFKRPYNIHELYPTIFVFIVVVFIVNFYMLKYKRLKV